MHEARFYRQFEALIERGQLHEAEALLKQHTEVVPPEERAAPFVVDLRFNDKVEMEAEARAEEAAIAIPVLNGFSRRLRNARYRRKVGAAGFSGVRVVSEGDSWFQYPVRLEDIIDNVAGDARIAVYSLGAAGDTVAAMAADGEYRRAIRDERPDAFLLSAGGNDLLGDGQLASVLNPYQAGMEPQDVLNRDALDLAVERIVAAYREIVAGALEAKPDLAVIGHAYDYPKPVANGRWLGTPLAQNGIPLDVGEQAVALILDRFHAALAALQGAFGARYVLLDVRHKVGASANSWDDELHPKDPGFARVAQPFVDRLVGVAPPAVEWMWPGTRAHERARHGEATRGPVTAAAWHADADDGPRARTPFVEATNIALTDFLRRENARRRRGDAAPRAARPLRMRSEEELWEAWQDIDQLRREICEPESSERRRAREHYSLGAAWEFDERIINENELDEFYVLSRGTRAGRAVGKVMIRLPDGRKGSGSGFLVGPGLMVTNNHVLESQHIAVNSEVYFSYELDIDATPVAPVRFRITDDVFLSDDRLDYTFVSVAPQSVDGRPLTDFGMLPLLPRSGKALKVERVSIIQHPRGDYKKVALRDNFVLGVARDFFYYVTDTDRGSSGSPVFNHEWQVAALHHRTVPDRNDPTRFLANRGVRISSILAHVTERRSNGEHAAEAVDLLLAEGRRIGLGAGDELPGDAPSPQPAIALDGAPAAAGGTVTGFGDSVLGDGPFAGLSVRDAMNALARRWELDEGFDEDFEESGDAGLEHATAPAIWTPDAARGAISGRAFELIVEHETGGPSYYNDVLKQAPTWPGGASGCTIGVGYDLGYKSLGEFRSDWSGYLDAATRQRLERTIGIKGQAAKALTRGVRDVRVPLETAGRVFEKSTLPKFVAKVYRTLPRDGLAELHPHCVGALVSLVLNRGASFAKSGDRYREMREIRRLIAERSFDGIPEQLRSMKRLWQNAGLAGLLRRRDDEAELFAAGLAEMGPRPGTGVETASDDELIDAYAEEPDESVWQAESAVSMPLPSAFERFTESSMPRYRAQDAKWVTDHLTNPDTWHLPGVMADQPFELTGEVIEALLRAGHYQPVTDGHGKLIVSLRGCRMLDAPHALENKASIRLEPVAPDHYRYKCVIGVYDTASRRISLYAGSTVPHRNGMLRYYNWQNHGGPRRWANLLPAGCYRHCAGTHVSARSGLPKFPDVLRLGHGPTSADADWATVLRSRNNLTYSTDDLWHRLRPKDNIHPAFSTSTFSSIGCLTVRGSQPDNGSHRNASGEWAAFQRAAGLGGNAGTRYDNLLTTGHEATTMAAVLCDGGELDALACLRHGSKGPLVRHLQAMIGVGVDGDFGAMTKERLAHLQTERLGFATGTWTRAMAEKLGFAFAPAGAPAPGE